MRRTAKLVCCMFAVALVVAGISATLFTTAASAQQVSDTADSVPWKLDFKADKLGSVNVNTKTGKSETIWYLAFTVTNNSGADVPLGLHFRLSTDTKKVYRETVHKAAEKLIEARLKKDDLKSASERPASLSNGESMHGVAIFGKLDPELDKISIAVHGLEDVVYRVGPKRFYRKNALILDWARPGDEHFTDRDPLKFKKSTWKTLEGPREIR